MQTFRRLLALITKEFLLILKDPKSRFVVIGPPLLQFLIFGYAATYDLQHVRYACFDESRSGLSRQFIAEIDGSGVFVKTKQLVTAQQIQPTIDNEKARLLIHIERNFEQDILLGNTAQVQVIADGRNPNVAMIALGYLSDITGRFNAKLLQDGVVTAGGPGIVLTDRAWFNANLSSRWYIVTGLGGVISMVIVMVLTSLSVAREREFGTFDQLLVAPFTPAEILLGKSLPGIVFGLLDALLCAAGAAWWFRVPFLGTVSALVAALFCFIMTMVGVGLFISSLARTMQQGLLGSFIFMLPAVMLSGLATPIENMPLWLQRADLLNPVRYIITALRAIFLQGAGLPAIWPQLWPLLVMAAVTLPAAAWLFRARSV